MHILEKWLLFVFCQKRRPKDQQMEKETNLASDQLMEKQQQQQLQESPSPDPLECPFRRVLLEGAGRGAEEFWPSRPASHSPAQLVPISICADIHLPPDVVPETRFVSFTITGKRHSGVAIEDDIEVLAPMATSEM